MKVTRRPLFISDIEECADYLVSEAGEGVARRWRESLQQTIALIAKFPEAGRLRHDLPFPGIRTFFLREFPRYLVLYRISERTVELLRVRHGMMHLPGLFEVGPTEG
jgi:plasmid stabilization system protein ParE